jgi:hypothetical protein
VVEKMDLFKVTYTLPRTVISEGQELIRHVVAPDFQIALKKADENKKDLELAKVELIERDVLVATS